MTKDQTSTAGKIVATAKCAGGCGADIQYHAEQTSDEATWPGLVPAQFRIGFAGGHLCPGCESVVLSALSARRAQRNETAPRGALVVRDGAVGVRVTVTTTSLAFESIEVLGTDSVGIELK